MLVVLAALLALLADCDGAPPRVVLREIGKGWCVTKKSSLRPTNHNAYGVDEKTCKQICIENAYYKGVKWCQSLNYAENRKTCILNHDVDDSPVLPAAYTWNSEPAAFPNTVHPVEVVTVSGLTDCYVVESYTETATLVATQTPIATASPTLLPLSTPTLSLAPGAPSGSLTLSPVAPPTIVPTPSPASTSPVAKQETTPTLSVTPVSPEALVPESPIPAHLVDQQQQTAKLASAMAVLSGISTGVANSAPALGKMAVLMQLECSIEGLTEHLEEPLPWEIHPIGHPVGKNKAKYITGAIVFNLVLILGTLTIHLIVVLAAHKFNSCLSFCEAMGLVRFPGLSYIPFLFLLQGLSLASFMAALNPDDVPLPALCFARVMCFVQLFIPYLLFAHLLNSKSFKASYVYDPTSSGYSCFKRLYRTVFGEKMWESNEDYFVERFGVVFEPHREGKQWWPALESGHVILISILAAFLPSSLPLCHARNAVLVFVLAAYLVAVALLRPYCSCLENFIAVFLNFCMTASVVVLSLGLLPGWNSPVLLSIAGFMLIVATFAILIKACYDLIIYTWSIQKSRRRRKHARAFQIDADNKTTASFRGQELVDFSLEIEDQDPACVQHSVSSFLIPNGGFGSVATSPVSSSRPRFRSGSFDEAPPVSKTSSTLGAGLGAWVARGERRPPLSEESSEVPRLRLHDRRAPSLGITSEVPSISVLEVESPRRSSRVFPVSPSGGSISTPSASLRTHPNEELVSEASEVDDTCIVQAPLPRLSSLRQPSPSTKDPRFPVVMRAPLLGKSSQNNLLAL